MATELTLFDSGDLTGDTQQVPVGPGESTNVQTPFTTWAATNDSQYTAELYTNPDCSGDPAARISAGNTETFSQGMNVQSIAFTS
ncbi:hypothetical protein [Streptomyces sp. NPDC127098]|uniref:hypothetical protein n=1 Tax=Streptomyces sp. NPDC127098 TaxID=3347137 RepID=UPI00364A3B22